MTSKLVTGATMLSLCLGSAAPALAQDYRFDGFAGTPGANATLNLRVPLGAGARRAPPTVGLTFGLGRTLGARLDGEPIVRQVPLGDFRFSEAGLANARLASFDLANPRRDYRLNLSGEKSTTALLIGGIFIAGIVICVAADCFDDDDGDTGSGGSTTPGNPG